MNVTSTHGAALRALLAGDDLTLDRLTSDATTEDETVLAALAMAAFRDAARRRFTAGWTSADVIRYVARVRTNEAVGDLSPSLAETLLKAALSEDKPYQAPDDDDAAYTQMVLLRAISAGLSEQERDHLIEESRHQAGRLLLNR